MIYLLSMTTIDPFQAKGHGGLSHVQWAAADPGVKLTSCNCDCNCDF
jgi:hypothetical protein